MKHLFFTAIVMGAIIAATGCNIGQPAAAVESRSVDYHFSEPELRDDFKTFRRLIEKKTAQLYTDPELLEKKLHTAENGIDGPMTELEFCRVLAPIAADLRCGHSFLSVSAAMENHLRTEALFFPLEVRIMDGSLFVIDDPFEVEVQPGTEITGIDGRSTEEILQRIYDSMPTDGNDTGRLRYDTERWFASMYYTYVETPDTFMLEILPPESDISERVEISAVRNPPFAKTAQGVMHDTSDTPWSISYEDAYAVLTIPTFSYSDKEAYADFLHSAFSEIKARSIDLLVLDVRGNYGGTPFPTAELFRYLINEPVPFFAEDNPFYLNRWKKPVEPAENAFEGDLRVLIDEAGFSMNGFIISLLKYHDIGTLIGAATSGGFKCSDASKTVVLPNTGLRFRFSTAVFQTAVEGLPEGMGIEPDIPVNWTVADYINGNDPVLNAALR